MANVVKLKRSAQQAKIPTTTQLELGEVALNTYDGNLFFKKDDGTEAIVTVTTTDGGQILTNKTIGDDLTVTGSLILETDTEALDLSSGAAILDDQGDDGTSGQFLSSTGSGVRWVTNTSGQLSGLSDVSLNSVTTNQIIKYNGTVWVNADENAVVTSAVFATNATSDLGLVTDANISLTEDLQGDGLGGDIDAYYNLGALAIDGVVGLRNVDQSLKADYISYSIIFGF